MTPDADKMAELLAELGEEISKLRDQQAAVFTAIILLMTEFEAAPTALERIAGTERMKDALPQQAREHMQVIADTARSMRKLALEPKNRA